MQLAALTAGSAAHPAPAPSAMGIELSKNAAHSSASDMDSSKPRGEDLLLKNTSSLGGQASEEVTPCTVMRRH